MIKVIVLFITLLFSSYAKADLKIEEWKQQNTFTDFGQEIEIYAKIKAVGLSKNQYHNYWGYVFDNSLKINVLSAIAKNSTEYKSTFGGNVLKIYFNNLYNNEYALIYFKYQILNNDENKIKYIRREWVQVPKFVKNAIVELKVKTLQNMDIYSTNYLFNKNSNNYYWSGTMDKDGINELFEMTLKKAKWKVYTKININNSRNSLNNLKVVVPLNFIGGNNNIINYNISNNIINNIDGKIIKKNTNDAEIKFPKYHSNNAFVKIEAEIENNYNNFYWLNDFDINDTLKINNDYVNEYNSLINKIQNDDKTNLPIHIKIAKWVNKNIKYDLNYTGRSMTSKEILRLKTGVCEHYSILYQDLLRSIGIPAKTISGISYSFDKKKFENHAWVIINYNSQWLPIDPTWGIYSGKLPISHIFLYNDIRNPIKYSMQKSLDSTNVEIINNAEYLD